MHEGGRHTASFLPTAFNTFWPNFYAVISLTPGADLVNYSIFDHLPRDRVSVLMRLNVRRLMRTRWHEANNPHAQHTELEQIYIVHYRSCQRALGKNRSHVTRLPKNKLNLTYYKVTTHTEICVLRVECFLAQPSTGTRSCATHKSNSSRSTWYRYINGVRIHWVSAFAWS